MSIGHRHRHFDDLFDLDLDDLLDDARLVEARCRRHRLCGWLAVWRGLVVVRAAEFDGEARCLALARIVDLLVAIPQDGEVELETCGEHLRERQREHLHAVLATTIGRDDVEVIALERARHEVREDGLWTDLDEGAHASLVHRLELLDKAHRLRDLPGEQSTHLVGILGVHVCGAVGVDIELWRGERDLVEECLERCARITHQWGVERGRDLESLVLHPRVCQVPFDLFDRARGAREDDLRWAVVIGDHDIHAPFFEARDDRVDICNNRGHGAVEIRGSRHQLAALARDAKEVFLRVNACVVERCELTEAVASDHISANAHRVEQCTDAEARCADSGLCPLRGGDLLALALRLGLAPRGPREDDVVKRDVLIERHICGAIPDIEHALEVDGELIAHVHILAALTREEEGDLARVCAVRVLDTVGRAVVTRRRALEMCVDKLELLLEILGVVRDDREPRRLARRSVLLRLTSEELEHVIVVIDVVHHLGHVRQKLARRISRPCKELAWLRAYTPLASLALVLFERDVEVGAAKPERTHRRATRVLRAANPGARGRVQVEGAVVDIDERVWLVDLDRRRDDAVVERHGDLEQARRTSGGLGVTDL